MIIQDFITQVKQGLARNNRYEVLLFPPPGLGAGPVEQMTLYCQQASIPGLSFSTASQRITGEAREFVYERTYDPITLTFYVDGQLNIPQFFVNWMNIIIDPNTRATNYYEQYVTDMEITIISGSNDREDAVARTIKLEEVYPKQIQSTPLSSSSRDVMTYTVSFVYKKMLMG